MSSNFTGVTFAEQRVTPADDAQVRRTIIPDCILSGCELSYSGSTLTMASGSLMVCGRQIRHPSAQNWAVVDATSGYARLLLTIDLTKTATADVFEQVVDTIEYASAEDGFAALIQDDINVAGTQYQVVVCVVSLGTGGITGIISELRREPGLLRVSGNQVLDGSLDIDGRASVTRSFIIYGKDGACRIEFRDSSKDIKALIHVLTPSNRMSFYQYAPGNTSVFESYKLPALDGASAIATYDILTSKTHEIVKLWENADPVSAFAGQTITIPTLANYTHVGIVIDWAATASNRQLSGMQIFELAKLADNKAILCVGLSGLTGHRLAQYDGTTGIIFDSGNQNGSTNNNTAVPYQIYGIKGVT